MNIRLLFKLLGILAILLGVFMLLSLIWANPTYGVRTDSRLVPSEFETRGFMGLTYSVLISLAVGGLLLFLGRGSTGALYRKEAMAVVGLSWVLATVLGALPYLLSGSVRGPAVRVFPTNQSIAITCPQYQIWRSWEFVDSETNPTSEAEFSLINALYEAGAKGLSEQQFSSIAIPGEQSESSPQAIFSELVQREPWSDLLLGPGETLNSESRKNLPADRVANYRIAWASMTIADALFDSQSGFSTTGATVISDLEDSFLIPHCILFWRASTHFLGGMGIIVLFVVILGQGSAGKALMRTEMPGPSNDGPTSRMQHTAWLFGAIYLGLNLILVVIYFALGMTVYDAICHAFATMATGGFSTYNASLGHFESLAGINGEVVEYVTVLFMILAGTNFTLLFFCLIGQPKKLFADAEFRTYLGIIFFVTAAIIGFGMLFGDSGFGSFRESVRYGLFQVVSIITTTGFGTNDFDQWNQFGRALILVLMFVGGCAGSTGGGVKVIRHLMLVKILGMQVDRAFQPKVVRLLRVGGKPVDDKTLPMGILVYFGLIAVIFTFSFLCVLMFEPDATWGNDTGNKLIDSASAVASTLNNIGPGLGEVGATRNYGNFSSLTKLLFSVLMMLGRLEIFPVLVLLVPAFWRDQ